MPAALIGILGSGLQGAMSGLGSMAGGIASGAIGAVAQIPNMAINAIGQAGNMVSNVFQGVVSAAGTVMQGMLSLASTIGGAVMGALSAFASAVMGVVRSAVDYARNIALIRTNTGLSYGQSAGMASRFGAFGIDAKQLAGMLGGAGMDPFQFKQRAAQFGLSGYESSNFQLQLATKYQSMQREGPQGQARARNMLETLGMNNDQIKFIVNLPPEKIRQQSAFQSNLNSQFGMTPGVIKKYAEDVPLMMNRVGSVISAFSQRLATAALPFIERALNLVTKLGSRFLPIFEGFIGSAAGWLESHADDIENAIMNGVTWLYASMPGLVVDGFLGILRGVQGFLGGVENGIRMLADYVEPVLAFFDTIINGVRELIATGAGAVSFIQTAISGLGNLINPLGGLLNMDFGGPQTPEGPPTADNELSGGATAGMGGMGGMVDIAGGLLNAAGGGGAPSSVPQLSLMDSFNSLAKDTANFVLGDPRGAFQRGRDAALQRIPKSHLVDMAPAIKDRINAAADTVGGVKDKIGSPIALLEKIAASLGSPEERAAVLEATRAIKKATEETAANSRRISAPSDIATALNTVVAQSAYASIWNGA